MSAATTSNKNPPLFPATQWTVVLAAGATRSPEAMAALGRLCGSYWYPLYAFVRRSGYSPVDAQDLTQEFFARLLEHNWVAHAARDKGRFRSFLLLALKRFRKCLQLRLPWALSLTVLSMMLLVPRLAANPLTLDRPTNESGDYRSDLTPFSLPSVGWLIIPVGVALLVASPVLLPKLWRPKTRSWHTRCRRQKLKKPARL